MNRQDRFTCAGISLSGNLCTCVESDLSTFASVFSTNGSTFLLDKLKLNLLFFHENNPTLVARSDWVSRDEPNSIPEPISWVLPSLVEVKVPAESSESNIVDSSESLEFTRFTLSISFLEAVLPLKSPSLVSESPEFWTVPAWSHEFLTSAKLTPICMKWNSHWLII
jgi:hypothetical protein